jgi:hypothetical protein
VTIDDPDVLAELRALSDRYEAALMTNDLGTLDAMFWQSQQVVRLGVGENLYGIDEIAAFRAKRPGGSPPRTVRRTTITSFGKDFGTVNVEFEREGGGPIGRQSQSWVRLPEGWRIVSAHVSLMGAGH